MTPSFARAVAVFGLGAGILACGGDSADPHPGAAAFDRFWSDFDRTYSYFEYKHIDWNADHDALRERAAAASSVVPLVAVLRDAVTPLRDVHVWFRTPGGVTQPSYTSTRVPNWDRAIWLTYLPGLAWVQGTDWGWGRAGDLGYIAVDAWDPSRIRIEDLDGALEQLRDTRALVLDVRMNGGGNDSLALQLAARFTTASIRFGAVRYRSGPAHSDFGPWTDRVLTPRGTWQYERPVYLLVGAGCFSSTETFVAAMRVLSHVTVAGDRTGGGSGNPKEFPLVLGGSDTGWKYSVSQWMETIADGTVIEWNGIPPGVALSTEPGRDAVLEWALAR